VSPTAQPLLRPGGAQTRVKLSIFGDYLRKFAGASRKAPDRFYIDGFAGGGKGIDPTTGEEYDGSAALALSVEPPFTRVILVEKDTGRAGQLGELAARHGGVQVYPGDVNVEIPKVLATLNPKAPTFAFLDPEGTQLQWTTLEALAAHKRGRGRFKVELLVLFPLQMAVLRLLNFKTGKIPLAHARRLDSMLGAETPWREIVAMRVRGDISTPEETEHAFLDAYARGLHRRLGYEYVLHCAVASERGRPLYYLVFASDCDVGERIMRHEFGAAHTEQGQLFNVAPFTPSISFDPDRERTYGTI
jgi:three-Cys-motif partner protein